MNGKYLGVVIGAVVAIMLVGSVLMPIINEQTTKTEQIPAEGAYGPDVGYFPIDAPLPNGKMQFQIQSLYSATDDQQDPDYKYIIRIKGYVNGDTASVYYGPRADLPDKMILYSDDIITVYLDGDNVYYSGQDITAGSFTLKMAHGYEVSVNWSGGDCFYTAGTIFNQALGNPTYYYRVFVEDGDYSNFIGDNPPSMDTPKAAAGGMYIGTKITETTTRTPIAPIYLAIPLVILVALLTAVAFVAFRRDY